MLNKILLLLSLVVLISSCSKTESNVKALKVNIDNLGEIAEKVVKDPSFTKEEIDLLNSSISFYGTMKDSLKDKTVADLINLERTKQNESSKSSLTNNLNRMEIGNNIAVAFDSFERAQEGGLEILIATYRFQNTSKTEIKTLKGFVDFFNQQGVLVKRYEINIDKPMPPGKVMTVRYPYGYDAKNERDRMIEENWKIYPRTWKPTLLEYKTGKTLKLLQQ